MNYTILTTSNSQNLKFYKSYIKSINSQNPLPQDIVFINDGVNNKYLQKYLSLSLNDKIKLIYLKNFFNLGISKSLNIGLKKIKTNLVFRLDIDDIWKKNHVKIMLREYRKNKNFLIYANASSAYKKGLADDNLIIDNPTIHSSWLINLNKNKNFYYSKKMPEDYATLSYYFLKNYKFKLSKETSVIYNNNPNSFSKKKIANKHLKLIRKKNLKNFLKKKNIFNFFFELKFIGILKFLKNL